MQRIKKSLSALIFGNKSDVSIENWFFTVSSFMVFLFAVLGIIWNLSLNLNLLLNIFMGLLILVFFAFYYFSRFKKSFSPFTFFIVSQISLIFLYIFNGGIEGSVPSLFIIYMGVYIVIFDLKKLFAILSSSIAILAALFIGESSFLKDHIVAYDNSFSKQMDLFFGYVVAIVIIFLTVRYFKQVILTKNEELKKELDSKNVFFNILAHDLRSPFNGIIGLSEIMADKSNKLSPKEYQNYSELINEKSQQTFELLDALLAWAKIQMNTIHLKPEKLELKNCVDETIQLFKEDAQIKNIKVVNEIPPKAVSFVDKMALQTILRNLLTNAIKFTPKNGKILFFAVEALKSKHQVVVKDTGIGMDKTLMNHLFDFKNHTNRKGTEGESSVGLGLTIVKELIDKLNEELTIESKVGSGSSFKFTIPRI